MFSVQTNTELGPFYSGTRQQYSLTLE